MKLQDWFQEELRKAQDTFDYRLERLLFELAEDICRYMGEQGLTRAELASRLSCSRAYITKILNGNPNVTLKTLLRIADALGRDVTINLPQRVHLSQSTVASAAPLVNQLPSSTKYEDLKPIPKTGQDEHHDLPLAA